MGRAKSDTYSSLFTKSDNVNLDETFDRKSVFMHVLSYMSSVCLIRPTCTMLTCVTIAGFSAVVLVCRR